MSVEADWIDTNKVFKAFYTTADLEELVAAAEDNRLFVAQALRRMLCCKELPIQQVIDAGFVLKCVEWIQCFDSPQLQLQSAWVLSNIAVGTPSQVEAIVDQRAIPPTVKLLTSSSESVRDHAAMVLGIISAESAHYRDLILNAGGLEHLIQSVDKATKLPMIKNATWALSRLCRKKPVPDFEVVKAAIPTLARLFTEFSQEQMLQDIAMTFSDLSLDSVYNAHLVQCQVVPRLVELMSHSEHKLQLAAIMTVGNLTVRSGTHIQVVIDCGALDQIKRLVPSANQQVLEEVVWIVSNIAAAGSKGQLDSLISSDVLPDIIRVSRVGSKEVMREACYAVANVAFKVLGDQVQYLTSAGALHLLGNALNSNHSSCVLAALNGLEGFFAAGETAGENRYVAAFKETGYSWSLVECQSHDSEIHYKALMLLGKYFYDEEQGNWLLN
jgi:hypothetical protein